MKCPNNNQSIDLLLWCHHNSQGIRWCHTISKLNYSLVKLEWSVQTRGEQTMAEWLRPFRRPDLSVYEVMLAKNPKAWDTMKNNKHRIRMSAGGGSWAVRRYITVNRHVDKVRRTLAIWKCSQCSVSPIAFSSFGVSFVLLNQFISPPVQWMRNQKRLSITIASSTLRPTVKTQIPIAMFSLPPTIRNIV